MEKFLYKYYKKNTKSFLKNYSTILVDESNIHKVRLNVKRINSIFTLLKITDNQFDYKNNYSPYKKFFSYIGRMRDIQIMLELLDSYKLPELNIIEFKNHLKESYRSLYLNLLYVINDLDINMILNKQNIIKSECSKFDDKKHLSEYFAKSIRKIRLLQVESLDQDRYHKIRKHLKKIGIIAEFLYSIKLKYEQFFLDVKNLEIEIGQWHDKFVLIEEIKYFLKDKPEKSFIKLKELKDKVEKENKILLNKFDIEINKSLKNINI